MALAKESKAAKAEAKKLDAARSAQEKQSTDAQALGETLSAQAAELKVSSDDR